MIKKAVTTSNKKIHFSLENFFCVFGLFIYFVKLITRFFLNRIGISDYADYLIFFLYFCLFIYYIYKNYKVLKVFGNAFLIFSFTLLLSFIFFPNNFYSDKDGFSVFEFLLFYPSLIAVYSNISDFKITFYWLKKFAFIFGIFSILLLISEIVKNGGTFSIENYDMTLGYLMSLCFCLLLSACFIKFNLLYAFECIALFSLSLFFGNRGSALTDVICLLFLVIFKIFSRKFTFKKLLLVVFILASLYFIYANLNKIIMMLINSLSQHGFSSRTLEGIIDNSVVEGSNLAREGLYQNIITAWKEMPIFGYGLLGDRPFCNGYYVHNFFLEIITHFGFFIGIFLITIFLLGIVWGLRNRNCNLLIGAIGCYILPYLMVSSSYLINSVFYVFVGLIVGAYNVKKNNKSFAI